MPQDAIRCSRCGREGEQADIDGRRWSGRAGAAICDDCRPDFLPIGRAPLLWPELAYFTNQSAANLLVIAWRLLAAGRREEAGQVLMSVWRSSMDGLSTLQEGRVALALFRRLGFTTDNPEEWEALTDPLTVYRAGEEAVSWSSEREVVEALSRMHDLGPIRSRVIAKADALAYITERGEAEVIVSSS
jgi:hypothetical protein